MPVTSTAALPRLLPRENHAMPHLTAPSRRAPAWRPLALAIAMLLPAAALAQQAPEPAAAGQDEDAGKQAATLDAVEVTAQRRVENVQDVPVSISTVNAERSEEHTSELQSLMRISYAVFCLKKKKNKK